MNLSADVYLQLVESLKTEPRRGREQRAAGRVGIGGQLKIQLVNGTSLQPSMVVRLRDLSVDGIGITLARPIAAGARFLVALPRQSGDELVLVCEVRHCDKVAEGVYNVGGKFVSDNAGDDRFGVGKSAKPISQAILS
jgi:hypothetical protein